jgi:methylenetetrahydrofolate reductase (NADPH)
VTPVLVVAGDVSTPEGELTSGPEIIESGLLEKHGINDVGVAGHPEGHREVPDDRLRDALRRKSDYARRTGAKVRVVTQFTFSAEPVIAWEAANRSELGQMPVVVGLPGLASAKTLLKFAMDCGVGASLQAFSKRAGSLTKLLTISAPDDIVVGLARHKAKSPESPISGVHFFPFGGLKRTAEWANKVAAGDFSFTTISTGSASRSSAEFRIRNSETQIRTPHVLRLVIPRGGHSELCILNSEFRIRFSLLSRAAYSAPARTGPARTARCWSAGA